MIKSITANKGKTVLSLHASATVASFPKTVPLTMLEMMAVVLHARVKKEATTQRIDIVQEHDASNRNPIMI